MEVQPPKLSFAFEARVRVSAVHVVGEVAGGLRRIIDIAGGEVSGPRLSGKVVPGGADWQIIRSDGVTDLEARYTIQAEDGALIYVRNLGYRHGPPEVMDRLARGEDVDPDAYYFRTAPFFETASPAHAWLNRTIFVADAIRHPDLVVVRIFAVE